MQFVSSRASSVHTRKTGFRVLRQMTPGIGNLRQKVRSENRRSIQIGRAAGDIEVTVLRGDRSVIEAIATEWEDLCMEGPSSAPFFTPTWIRAWFESFAPSAKVVLVTAKRNGQLRGVLPLVEQRIGFRGMLVTRLSAPSNYHSGRADLVHGSEDAAEVVAAIWGKLNLEMRWDVLEYRDVVEESGFSGIAAAAARSGSAVIKRETIRSPYLAFDLATDLSKLGPAKGIRRTQRLLAKDGTYYVRRTAPADASPFERLVRQEDSGWKGKAGTAIAREPAVLAFYTTIASARTSSFTTVINEIVFNDEPIAIALGIEMGNRYFGVKPTYSEAHHRYGPGQLIQQEILRDLPNRSISEFDMLGHDDPYKMAWTSTTRQHYHYLVFRRSLKGHILHRGVELLVPLVKYWRASLQKRSVPTGRNPDLGPIHQSSAS